MPKIATTATLALVATGVGAEGFDYRLGATIRNATGTNIEQHFSS